MSFNFRNWFRSTILRKAPARNVKTTPVTVRAEKRVHPVTKSMADELAYQRLERANVLRREARERRDRLDRERREAVARINAREREQDTEISAAPFVAATVFTSDDSVSYSGSAYSPVSEPAREETSSWGNSPSSYEAPSSYTAPNHSSSSSDYSGGSSSDNSSSYSSGSDY